MKKKKKSTQKLTAKLTYHKKKSLFFSNEKPKSSIVLVLGLAHTKRKGNLKYILDIFLLHLFDFTPMVEFLPCMQHTCSMLRVFKVHL